MARKEIKKWSKYYLYVTAVFKGRGKSLDFIGFLGWKRRIYTLFTPLEDRIGIVRTGKALDESYVFFLRIYVGVYYLKNQITYDKL